MSKIPEGTLAEGHLNVTSESEPPDLPPNTKASPLTSIAWLNLQYTVSGSFQLFQRTKPKLLLQRLNGHFTWSYLNGILGPSGAGKTTLLNCLAGVSPLSAQSGTLYLDKSLVAPDACLVEQHVNEGIPGQLTVGQILAYAYQFKNDRRGDVKSMEPFINDVLSDLMLDTSILQTPFSKCSGGEQKRIVIAQELMARKKPAFLLLDEPTTGLDSEAAYVLMASLRGLTQKYQLTVIATIHVPADRTLALFDKLLVLAKGGTTIYSGPPLGLGAQLEEHLGPGSVEKGEKPIEVAIKVACRGSDDHQVRVLANHYLRQEHRQITDHLENLRPLQNGLLDSSTKGFSFPDLLTATQRYSRITFISSYRTFFAQLSLYICNLLLFATIFDHEMVRPDGCQPLATLDANSTTAVNCDLADERLLAENFQFLTFTKLMQGILFLCCSYLSVLLLARNGPSEVRNKWYSPGVSYWSLTFVYLLQMSIFVFAISIVGYFASEQHFADHYQINWARLSHYTLSLWLYFLYIQSGALLVGIQLMENIEIGTIIALMTAILYQIGDDFFYLTDQLASPPFIKITELFAFKYLTRYSLWAIYGIDRCDAEMQFSSMLVKHAVDVDSLPVKVASVLLNTFVLRLLLFILIKIKYTGGRLPTWKGQRSSLSEHSAPQLILFEAQNVPETQSQLFIINSNEEMAPDNQLQLDDRQLKGQTLLAWSNLTLFKANSSFKVASSSSAYSQRPILSSLSGHVSFGSLTALMGISGSGKTSLLRVLNGQCKSRLDGGSSRFFASLLSPIRTCYLTQDVSEHLLPGLTVKQLLIYASRLKNASSKNELDHEKMANSLLGELDLQETANRRENTLSGGERKRLALALELTSAEMPNLVCIDEPTSGLDSSSALKVITCLRTLAHKHSLAIITSLHQPSNHLLNLFDQLYILARGGVCVYSGPPELIGAYLHSIPQIVLTESKYPIETLIQYACSDSTNEVVGSLRSATQAQLMQGQDDVLRNTGPLVDGVGGKRVRFSLASFKVLFQRMALHYAGHGWKSLLAFTCVCLCLAGQCHLLFDPVIASASGCLSLEDDFNQTCTISPERTLEEERLAANLNYVLFGNNFLAMILMHAGVTFFFQVPLFFNEHRNGWYSSGVFYLVTCLYQALPLLPTLIFYAYMQNIYEPVQPGIYWSLLLVLLLSLLAFQGFAHLFALLFGRNVILIDCFILVVFLLSIVLSNLISRLNQMHYVFQLMANFSIIRFSLESSLILQYGFGRCSDGQFSAVLTWMSLDDADYYGNLGMLLFNAAFYRGLAFWLLVKQANPAEGRQKRVKRIEAHFKKRNGENI